MKMFQSELVRGVGFTPTFTSKYFNKCVAGPRGLEVRTCSSRRVQGFETDSTPNLYKISVQVAEEYGTLKADFDQMNLQNRSIESKYSQLTVL